MGDGTHTGGRDAAAAGRNTGGVRDAATPPGATSRPRRRYNNKVDASDGKDFIYAEEGVHNTFVGGPDDDQIAVVGKDNYLHRRPS